MATIITVLVIAGIIFLLIGGFPMIASLIAATAAIIYFNIPNLDTVLIIQQYIAGVSTFALLAIPMFIFAAEIMSYGNTANSLVDFVKAFCGHIYGGLAITVAGACTIFGAISGSSNATVVAIGKPMRQRMISSGYDVENTDALICTAAIIAGLIPPSISMIMYCVITGTSVGELFIAGIIPGLIVFALLAVYNYFYAKKHNTPRTERLSWRERLHVTRKSLLALGFPVLIIGGIYSGVVTPTEAAALSVIYAIIIEMIIYRSVKIKDLMNLALSTGVMTTAIFILIAVGQGFSWIIAYLRVPEILANVMLGANPTALRVTIVITIAFWIAGMFVDTIVAMLIMLPILFPMAMSVGLDPIYVGIIVSLQAVIGCITPPFGSNIFVACAAFDTPYLKIAKGLPVYLIIVAVVSLLYIMMPDLALVYRMLL